MAHIRIPLGQCSCKLKICAVKKIPAPTQTVPMAQKVVDSAENCSSVRAPAMGNNATRIRTSVKRHAGESSSQCAATKSKTPAQSRTPPSATASSTGQRKRSLELCESSNVRMRPAVPASTTPAETQRSSCFSSASAMPAPPLICFLLIHHHTEAFRSKEIEPQGTPHATNIVLRVTRLRHALLVYHQHAGFGVIRRRKIMKRHVNIFAFGLAIFDQYGRNAFRNFPFLLRRPSLHPGNLHVRHGLSSLERATLEFVHAKRWHSIRRSGSRKARAAPVLELFTHASGDSSPHRVAAR